ncbi:hypothetical protein [Mesobacillus jeotgali]|uniref:hypothetical protein n=1 Tax=Mesobacillus jeotgali TaxID=129985 RepID=UPI00177A8AB2|nr:hypothetical protein [Mesobacillus jeotgali]UYZ22351.1 hypothetical protein FOF60_01795 [Mesobacillus jeotgali]
MMKRKLKRKLLYYGTSTILLLTVLIAMDRYKLYKEEKPPVPIVTVNGQEIPHILGQYDWHGTKTEKMDPLKAMAGMNPSRVKERETLEVSFPSEIEPESITISQVNTLPGQEEKTVKGNSISIPKNPYMERTYFKIKAVWGKEFSTSFVKLDVEELPPLYDFLSKDPEKLAVLAIVPRGESEKFDIPDEVKEKLDSFQISDDLEELKKTHPEIRINTPPIYLIFNTEYLQQTVDDKETLIRILTYGDRQ